MESKPASVPAQGQEEQPGREHQMTPQPEIIREGYKGSDKLKGKVALITGGDSGIGRSAAVHFAREGADVAIIYLDEDTDAQDTQRLIEKEGRRCILIAGDVGQESFCQQAVERTVRELGKLNIVVNNAAEQHPKESITDITAEQLEQTFRTNIFGMFYITKAAQDYLQAGDTIINTTSVTSYKGSEQLLDYSSTKGAITSFTRSLSQNLAEKGIRVNGVAPGPIWTPLIPSTFPPDKVASFGKDVPLGRPGQPSEVGPCYVFLASDDSSYMTGQILHPNGGSVVNS
jgi:NAD(P)-dependent dehydrogenase (short-subunit alcohol dehydrogenase family)